jgi:hypothetical protein
MGEDIIPHEENEGLSIIHTSPATIQTVADVTNVFNQIIQSGLGVKRIGHNELKFIYRGNLPKVIDKIREIIREAETEVMFPLWNQCKRDLQYELVFLNDDYTVDLELYKKLELNGLFISKAFLKYNNFLSKRQSPYSKNGVNHNLEVTEHLLELLQSSPPHIAKDIIESINQKMLYLFCRTELDYHHGLSSKERAFNDDDYNKEAYTPDGNENIVADELQASIESGCPPPHETMPFCFWFWDHAHELYRRIMIEVLKIDYDEARQQFYEVYNRTNKDGGWDDSIDTTVLEELEKYLPETKKKKK